MTNKSKEGEAQEEEKEAIKDVIKDVEDYHTPTPLPLAS